jgi:ankyrin repeat protein
LIREGQNVNEQT